VERDILGVMTEFNQWELHAQRIKDRFVLVLLELGTGDTSPPTRLGDVAESLG
jgi:hypothetical protein